MRLLGKAKLSPKAKPSLRGWSRGRKRTTDLSSVLPDADPLEAKRTQAEIQSTAARLVMTRHKTEQMRAGLVERDKHQAEIGAATVELIEQLTGAALAKEVIEAISDDLGDLAAEGLRVTR